VTPVNDAPVANNDTASTAEDTPVNNINVLGNDTDVDGDTLSVLGVPIAGDGTITVNPDGTLNYTPNANFKGTDVITYTITDGNGGTDTATVTVRVADETGRFFDTPPGNDNLPDVLETGQDRQERDHESGRSVVRAVHEIGGLGYLSNIEGLNRIILETANQVENLNGIGIGSGQKGFVINAINWVDQMTTFDRFAGRGFIQNDDFTAKEFTGFSARWNLVTDSSSRAVDSIMLDVLANDQTIMLQVSEIKDGGRQIGVRDFSVTLADGRALPAWLIKGEKGLIFAELPADVKSIEIKLSVVLQNGKTMTGYFTIQSGTGEITEMDKETVPEQLASLFSDQLVQSAQQKDEGFVNLANALSKT